MQTKSILISGGSRGLGSHITEHLLKKGHRVSTFARRITPLVQELAGTYPDQFAFREADATNATALEEIVNSFAMESGTIDVLINNAAIGQDHLLAHTAPEVIRSIIAVNIEAPILLTRLVIKKMLLQETGGRVVNISSICGSKGFTGLTAYSASKGAMDAFTRSLAHEVSGRGILVNSIAPGFFESEMSAVLSPEQLAVIKRRTPTSNLTTDLNLMPLLDLLLFAETNMTGQILAVDGGASV